MSHFRQVAAVTGMNLRSLPQRLGSSSVIVFGIMGVVGVLLAALAMAQSLTATLRATGREDRAIVLRDGVEFEPESTLSSAEVTVIKAAPGIGRTAAGDAAASEELVTAVELPRARDQHPTGVMVRGVSKEGFAVRPEVKLIEGRTFTPGLHEVIVGQSVRSQFNGAGIGDRLHIGNGVWSVVGVFKSGNGLDSTILTDTATLQSAYQRTDLNSITVLLQSPQSFTQFKAALTSDPTLSVSVYRELDYFEMRSNDVVVQILVIAYAVSAIMAVGALFAALNTMHSAVSRRSPEIATLRAIGFGGASMVVSVLVEALTLAVVGALLGAAVVWLVFSGVTVSLGGSTGSLMAEMRVTPSAVLVGLIWASVTGFFGGIFPALRAARLPIATALRPG